VARRERSKHCDRRKRAAQATPWRNEVVYNAEAGPNHTEKELSVAKFTGNNGEPPTCEIVVREIRANANANGPSRMPAAHTHTAASAQRHITPASCKQNANILTMARADTARTPETARNVEPRTVRAERNQPVKARAPGRHQGKWPANFTKDNTFPLKPRGCAEIPR
jgi:hypothetical protein